MADQLVFSDVQPPSASERGRRTVRKVLIDSIGVQIRLAQSYSDGGKIRKLVSKIARTGTEPSPRRIEVQVTHRSWFWRDYSDDMFYYQVRYANRVIDLSRCGQMTIVGGSTVNDLIASLRLLEVKVTAGDFDDILSSTRRSISASHHRAA